MTTDPPPDPPQGRHARGRGFRIRLSRRRLVLAGVAIVAVVGGAIAAVVTAPWSPDGGPDPGGAAGTPGPTAPGSAAPPDETAEPDDGPRGEPPDAQPARAGFPDETSTGVPEGVSLTRSGPIAVREDGAVIENLEIIDDGSGAAGLIEVFANDVTIRNVRITNDRNSFYWGILQREGFQGLVVEDSEVFGSTDGDRLLDSGISNHGGMITVRRVEIHTVSDAIVTSQGLIEDNYLHSPRYADGDHTDMIQSNGGSTEGIPLEIRHNTVINTLDQTSAVFLQDFTGAEYIPIQGVVIEGNWLAGGGYVIYGGGEVAEGEDPADIVIRDNVFSREVFPDGGYWGPVAYFDGSAPGNEWAGNVWDDGSRLAG